MKKIFSYFMFGVFLLACQGISAKDIFLSATGDDSKDGLSEVTAVKTLMRVNDIIEAGDNVYIKGIIKITEEVDYATKIQDGTQDPPTPENGIYLYHRGYYFRNADKLGGITFIGSDPANDGFSGEEEAALFQFDGAQPITFKNLVFKNARTHRAANGLYGSDASVAWCAHTELTFENCVFTANDVTRSDASPADVREGWGNRGTISVNSGTVTFKNCEFTENSGEEGGVLFLSAGNVTIENCYFGYNESADVNNSKGGAIYTWVHGIDGELNVTISKSVFEGNTASKGGAIAMLDKVSYVPTATTFTIDRCTFIGNQATQSQGGAILLDNFTGQQSSDALTITNSLFYANGANTDGGAVCIWNVQPNSSLTMINCTLNGNYTNGNAGNGGGLGFMTGYETYLPANMTKNIYNCIFDGNYATEGGALTTFSDLTALYSVAEQSDVFNMKNSYVGTSINMVGRNGIDADLNMIDYYPAESYDGGVIAGLDDADYYAIEFHAIPLFEDAETRTFGNSEYLVGTRDIMGKERTIEDGKCAIGACEVTSVELDEGVVFEDDVAIASPKAALTSNLSLENGILFCSEEAAVIELYDLSGNIVLKGNGKLLVGNLISGVYIAKVKSATVTYSQKLIIK